MKEVTRNKDRFDFSHFTSDLKKKNKVLSRLKRNGLKEKLYQGTYEPSDQFETDPELKGLRILFEEVENNL